MHKVEVGILKKAALMLGGKYTVHTTARIADVENFVLPVFGALLEAQKIMQNKFDALSTIAQC